METITCIKTRRSIRNFTSKEVTDETLKDCIRAASYAPSSVDSQPWEFIIIRKNETKNTIAATREENNQVERRAPVLVVVCADLNKSSARWIEDCSLAAMCFCLAAHNKGLASTWLTAYKNPESETEKTIKKLLNLPDFVRPLCVLATGYPNETPQPKKVRSIDEITHKEKW